MPTPVTKTELEEVHEDLLNGLNVIIEKVDELKDEIDSIKATLSHIEHAFSLLDPST